MMQLELSGRGRLSHITAQPPPPDDRDFIRWTQKDSLVISWIIGNIDSELQNQFLDYPTARDLWKGIETLYGGSKDGLEIYDLTVKANTIKQGIDPIEVYYSKLTGIWKEIDRRSPNPMICPEDRTLFIKIYQNNRLYQILAGIDESLDKDCRDLLKQEPLPTPEEAYATIRREIARRRVMKATATTTETPSSIQSSGIGSGFAVKGKAEKPFFRQEDERSGLRCSYCGGTRHTKEGCFKIIGYPEWWNDQKKKGEKRGSGKAAAATGEPAREEGGGAAAEEGGYSDRQDYWAWY